MLHPLLRITLYHTRGHTNERSRRCSAKEYTVNETDSTTLPAGTVSTEVVCLLSNRILSLESDNILVLDAESRDVISAKLLNGVCMTSAGKYITYESLE